MQLKLLALLAISLIELLIWLRPLWPFRLVLAAFCITVQSVIIGLIFGSDLTLWTALLLILSGYRVVNLLRVVEGRVNSDYLYLVSRKSALYLMSAQGLAVLAAYGIKDMNRGHLDLLYGLAVFQMVAALIVLRATLRNLKKSRTAEIKDKYADRDLPAISICIPARNETEDLEECLRSLTESTYPKFEILVLDDCSQNKRTPEIIRSFAQQGVRFIAGDAPDDSWLAKNFAYKQLSDQASGEILLFCGVDTRFEPSSIRLMVETMLERKKSMVSYIPKNLIPKTLEIKRMLVQPSRYAWEISLPRRTFARPPVLSTCWLIESELFKKNGGFEAVQRSAAPESYFARQASKTNDGYAFLQSYPLIGLASTKPYPEQRDTAVRTRYPQLHRRPEMVALSSLSQFVILISPLILDIYGLASNHITLFVICLTSTLIQVFVYSIVCRLTFQKFLFKSLWMMPIAVAYDIGLLNYSMCKYEFSEVLWKGRNICLPVMRVAPKSYKA
jgi:glycosyltransferase involved in cell wall biosynthesis